MQFNMCSLNKFRIASLLLLILTIAACGKKLDGTYSDESGVSSFKFKTNGKVISSALGMETEMDYTIEDNKIKVNVGNGGNMLMTLDEDGSIEGPMGVKLTKKDK